VPRAAELPALTAPRPIADDLRAASQLLVDATTGVNDVVEEMHQAIAPWPLHVFSALAYAGVQRPLPPADGRPRPARGREAGGCRAALAGALPQIARRHGAGSVELVFGALDPQWGEEARVRGWSPAPTAFPGTLAILDSHGFLEALRPVIAERTGGELVMVPTATGARLEAAGVSAALSTLPELTALVFGSPTDEACAVPPLPPMLAAVVRRGFPLPLLWYGYDYV
jgi:hypothetical protein